VVENTGKTPRADTYQPVNAPEPLKVGEGVSGLPVAIGMKQRQPVSSIEDRWRIDDEWWRTESISRLYYKVLLNSGQRLVLYKDLVTGGWYQQDY
jgi:hypothetical protein